MMPPQRKRVLVVDDSALIRRVMSLILERHPGLEVVGTATDPYDAREKIKALAPDVLTLDVEMPRMDGLTFLGKLQKAHPLPVVMVSSLTAKGTATALDALALGAVDVIGKPEVDPLQGLEAMGLEIAEAVYAAAQAALPDRPAPHSAALPPPQSPVRLVPGRNLIAIGSSTGGTEALREIFQALPAGLPPIAVVQHMLPGFTEAFAARLDRLCAPRVKLAEDGESLHAGTIYFAPSGCHLRMERHSPGLAARLVDGPPVSRHRPSANVLFESAAETCRSKALGIILTGMGDDGAEGLFQMREAGAHTLGQDESSSVVYGMPKMAWLRGAVVQQAPLAALAHHMLAWSTEP